MSVSIPSSRRPTLSDVTEKVVTSTQFDDRAGFLIRFCEDEIAYYTRWGQRIRTTHWLLRILALSIGALVPILVLNDHVSKPVVALLSALVWLLAALDQGCGLGENADRKSMTMVALMLELQGFVASTGAYRTRDDASLTTFEVRLKKIISDSAAQWRNMRNRHERILDQISQSAGSKSNGRATARGQAAG